MLQWQKIKSKILEFLILFLPATIMIGFISWAVYETTIKNKTEIITLTNTQCLVKTDYATLTTWLKAGINAADDIDGSGNNSNGEKIINIAGGNTVYIIISKMIDADCADVFI